MHEKADPDEQSRLKKLCHLFTQLEDISLKPAGRIHVFTRDEARFGLNWHKRRYCPKGFRPPWVVRRDMSKGKPRKGRAKKVHFDVLKQINLNAAGTDIGSESIYVSVPEDRDAEVVRIFGSFTSDLLDLASWLKEYGIETVAMNQPASTGLPCSTFLKNKALRFTW